MNKFTPYLSILKTALNQSDSWRSLFGKSNRQADHLSPQKIEVIIQELQRKLEGNYPFHHPQYAGQMLKPPHPIAWLAYTLTSTINPNNHALDGGPPTSEMEKESIRHLAEMVGYKENYLGHLTSAGTIANLEALFVARELHPDKFIAATANAHYTHSRMCRVLNTNFLEIPVDSFGHPDIDFLKEHHDKIGTLVVTMGTTGLGFVEPLAELLTITKEFGIRVHVDAAYGGFFKTISKKLPSATHWNLLHEADSIVIDPHKHGLQPYGCGSVLYKDASVGRFFKHDSPYTYFTSDDLHLGEISLECSRAGASAAAFWATIQLLPLNESGIGRILKSAREAALMFQEALNNSDQWECYNSPDLDIIGYFKKPAHKKFSDVSMLSNSIFEKGMSNQESGYHLSLFRVPADQFKSRFDDYETDSDSVVILRSVFMKEEHEQFIPELVKRLKL